MGFPIVNIVRKQFLGEERDERPHSCSLSAEIL